MLHLATVSPVPNDLELAIPGNIPFFEFLIVFSFILHIILVNMTVGGSVLAVFQEIKGIVKKDPIADRAAFHLATQVSVLKSLAVVLGVAPLLIISTIYTQYFYPSTILIGKAWLMLIVLLIVAFLLLYAYKFSWEKLKNNKGLHLFFGISGAGILLFVPLIFIVNVASMLYPELWRGSEGFFHGLFYYPTVWQRYFHFLAATFSIMGIFLIWWANRQLKHAKNETTEGDEAQAEVAATSEDGKVDLKVAAHEEMKSLGKKTALLFTLLQILAGPILLLGLESNVRSQFLGQSAYHTTLLAVATVAALALAFLFFQLYKKESKKMFMSSLILFVFIIGLMGTIRHEVRELYLEPYKEEIPRTVATQNQNAASE